MILSQNVEYRTTDKAQCSTVSGLVGGTLVLLVRIAQRVAFLLLYLHG